MKFFSILSASALIAGAVAGPISGPIAAPVAGAVVKRDNSNSTDWYRFKIKAEFDSIDGKWLRAKSNVIGVYDNGLEGNAIQVLLGDGENSEVVSLPTYPVGIVEHALGLVGKNGYLEFQDLTQPSGHNTDDLDSTETYSWKEFALGEPDDDNLRELTWGVKDAIPGWIALPIGDNQWKIKNYDGDAVVIQNYVPVKIMAQRWDQE
ncbi:hypothetical protein EDB80DRAFT_70038 [Ilyonectria destructans]|nr:hypothetical protein EDB80DRAFT_70038 [Ilyonectria destructans]